MRFFFITFMLLFFPLHVTWAAASAYCQHETGSASYHFGHHAHAHKSNQNHDSHESSSKKLFHEDCGYCHSATASFVPIPCSKVVLIFQKNIMNFQYLFFTAATPLSIPEKPNWSFVV